MLFVYDAIILSVVWRRSSSSFLLPWLSWWIWADGDGWAQWELVFMWDQRAKGGTVWRWSGFSCYWGKHFVVEVPMLTYLCRIIGSDAIATSSINICQWVSGFRNSLQFYSILMYLEANIILFYYVCELCAEWCFWSTLNLYSR